MHATIPPGATTFDVADRLAIVNLLHSYGWLLDGFRMDDYFALFTASPTIEVWSTTSRLFEGWQTFRQTAASRREHFRQIGVQRRHVLAAPRFDTQGIDHAAGQVYMQMYKTQQNLITLVAVGYYEFAVVKQGGEWKIDRWIIHMDTTAD